MPKLQHNLRFLLNTSCRGEILSFFRRQTEVNPASDFSAGSVTSWLAGVKCRLTLACRQAEASAIQAFISERFKTEHGVDDSPMGTAAAYVLD